MSIYGCVARHVTVEPCKKQHTTTTVLRPFVRDYPGEPIPEETLTHPPSWSSPSLYQLLPSTMIHSILLVQITCLAIFLHSLFPCPLWSTSWSGALHLIFHTFLHPISVHSHVTHASSCPPESTIQTASWSVQLFLHDSRLCQIDRQPCYSACNKGCIYVQCTAMRPNNRPCTTLSHKISCSSVQRFTCGVKKIDTKN